jgi:catechol-2,3-dioxygenase
MRFWEVALGVVGVERVEQATFFAHANYYVHGKKEQNMAEPSTK